MKRTALATLLLLAAALTACGETAQSPVETSTKAETEAVTAAETEAPVIDLVDKPELDGLDFGGAVMRIRTTSNPNVHGYIDVKEENGDTLDDAIYRRNRTAEDKLNFVIEEVIDDSPDIRRILLSGDDAYELCNTMCPMALTYWSEGLVIDMDTLPHVDLSKNYWARKLNDSISINGRNYVALGAYDVNVYDLTYALTFNKQLVQDFDMTSPYELVKTGKWTIDQMNNMMIQVLSDLDGDGKMTETDRYGYLAHPKMVLPNFWIAADTMTILKNENDYPVVNILDDRFMNLFSRVFEITWDNNAWFSKTKGDFDVPSDCKTIFTEGRGLFLDMSFFHVESLRSMEIDFGIIPYPKLDEAQEEYYTRVSYYWATVIPNANSHLDMTGAFLEEMNYESAKIVIPAYYDTALKSKYSRDEESAEMLDLILDNRVVDLGDSVFCDKIRDDFMFDMFKSNKRELASTYEKKSKSIQKVLDKIPTE
ncbi:MAG: hypothetical protein MJ175_05275 [Clostridia bacterium]|nr:hypothetical protein [Clostridia bacterium]